MVAKSRPKTIITLCRSRKERALDLRVSFFHGILVDILQPTLVTQKMRITLWFSCVHDT